MQLTWLSTHFTTETVHPIHSHSLWKKMGRNKRVESMWDIMRRSETFYQVLIRCEIFWIRIAMVRLFYFKGILPEQHKTFFCKNNNNNWEILTTIYFIRTISAMVKCIAALTPRHTPITICTRKLIWGTSFNNMSQKNIVQLTYSFYCRWKLIQPNK